MRRRLGRLLVVLFSCAVSAGVALAASAAGAVSPVGPAVRSRVQDHRTADGARRAWQGHLRRAILIYDPDERPQDGDAQRADRVGELGHRQGLPVRLGRGPWRGRRRQRGRPRAGPQRLANWLRLSGAVAAVLTRVGLWPAGSGVPNDAGMISALLRNRLIAAGPATAPDGVTLYDHPGVHIFMNINGRSGNLRRWCRCRPQGRPRMAERRGLGCPLQAVQAIPLRPRGPEEQGRLRTGLPFSSCPTPS